MNESIERRLDSVGRRLETYIYLGIRDAKDQPEAPAITLTGSRNRAFIESVFEEMNEEYSPDVSRQAETFCRFLRTGFGHGFHISAKVFSDHRINEEGFHVYMTDANGNAHLDADTVRDYFLHPSNNGFSPEKLHDVGRLLRNCDDCRRVALDNIKFY